LGGVFIKINYAKTSNAFKTLGVAEFDDYFTQTYSNDLFTQLEEGKISEENFYSGFRTLTQTNLSNKQIETAWNAMLENFWQERLNWLERVSKEYCCYLFSNTNSIHYKAFMKNYVQENAKLKPFNSFFIKAFYSQQIGYRKPHVQAYTFVLQQANINANETLFIDDTLKNIEGASLAGLKTLHLTTEMDLTQLKLPL
jgi:putative hydrolase of the HAD superfamily